MFQVGDFIVYGTMGVCRVTELSEQESPGDAGEQLYYTLEPTTQSCTIHTPADNSKVFMRPILSKDEAVRLIDIIPTIRAKAYHSRVTSELIEHYQSALRTYNCADLVELTVSIYTKKQAVEEQKRKFGFVDEKYLKRAEELLFSELGAALGIPLEEVPAYIAARTEELNPVPVEA